VHARPLEGARHEKVRDRRFERVLTFVGAGLWDERDLSLRGQDACKEARAVFAEWYTAFLGGTDPDRLAAVAGKPVRALARSEIEESDLLLDEARRGPVVLLTAGDPMTATTHVELRRRAEEAGIPTRIVHGASIATAASGLLGLQHYKFGRQTTLVFPHGNYFPLSPYEVIQENADRGLHSLVLLDLRADESPRTGDPFPGRAGPGGQGRFLTAMEGARILERMEEQRRGGILAPRRAIFAIARAGSPVPDVARGSLRELAEADLGPPLHAIVVPGALHFSEEEAVRVFARPLAVPDAA
jgi:diphthine synthase